MKTIKPILLFCLLFFLANKGIAESTIKQTFQSCTVIASELLTGTQFYQKGFTLTELFNSLPGLTKAGKQRLEQIYTQIAENGLLSTYSAINSRYARCAKEVYSKYGKPEKSTLESLFYFCSGENKLRYEAILAFIADVPIEDILKKTPAQRRQLIAYMKTLFDEKGTTQLFDFSATELKRCINQ